MEISVIIPAYNASGYIERCMDSVLSQTYKRWEMIVVNDGSADHTLDILNHYAGKDSRIQIINQENQGPGRARNTGIEAASGDYVVFIDSDDRIRGDYFEKLSKETADVVFIDIDQVDENFRVLRKEYLSEYQSLSKNDFLRSQMTGRILWGGVRKAVKLKHLMKHQIRFTRHEVGEEALYSFLLLYYAETFSFIKGPVYEYVNRMGSQSAAKDVDPLHRVGVALRDKVLQMGLYDEYADTINAFIATAAIISLDRLAGMYGRRDYRIMAGKRGKRYAQDVDSDYPVDIRHMGNKAKVLYPFLKAGYFMPIYLASRINRAGRKREICKFERNSIYNGEDYQQTKKRKA